MTEVRPLHRIIRLRDLPDYVGLQRTQIDELISKGEFPEPIRLSDTGRAKGWLEADVIAWQQRRIAARERDEARPQPKGQFPEARRDDNG